MKTQEPVFIITYNLLSTTKQMVDDILRMNGIPIIIDNQSTYPPLLDWFEEIKNNKDIVYVKMHNNYGPHVVHNAYMYGHAKEEFDKIQEEYKNRFKKPLPECPIITDCDLDISEIPNDALHVLRELQQYNRKHTQKYLKIGFSLRIDDIPNHSKLEKNAYQHEKQFYVPVTKYNNYSVYEDVLIDTTFHIFDQRYLNKWFYGPAIRLAEPYMARHIPWYWNSKPLDEESTYYLEHLEHLGYIGFSKQLKQEYKL